MTHTHTQRCFVCFIKCAMRTKDTFRVVMLNERARTRGHCVWRLVHNVYKYRGENPLIYKYTRIYALLKIHVDHIVVFPNCRMDLWRGAAGIPPEMYNKIVHPPPAAVWESLHHPSPSIEKRISLYIRGICREVYVLMPGCDVYTAADANRKVYVARAARADQARPFRRFARCCRSSSKWNNLSKSDWVLCVDDKLITSCGWMCIYWIACALEDKAACHRAYSSSYRAHCWEAFLLLN